MCVCHLYDARQIYKGKDADPHDVQKVPEEAETSEARQIALSDLLVADDLHGKNHHPDQSDRHVQTVRSDQREERR
jgi:hypothetical protein